MKSNEIIEQSLTKVGRDVTTASGGGLKKGRMGHGTEGKR